VNLLKHKLRPSKGDSMILPFNGRLPVIGKNVYIAPTACVIGDVIIGDDSSVWPSAVLRGDMNQIVIGNRTNIQDGSVIHVAHDHPTVIGNNVTIGHLAHVHGATIEDEVLIGSNSTILDGVIVEKHCMIAAGALVSPRSRIGNSSLVAGLPAVIKRSLSESEINHIITNAEEYIKLKDIYISVEKSV